ncbi:hypothetical protein CABS01_01370 [Colletotrichum abscissum]|uniref:CENP-V/GFA domain-containing protein n=1 Tax=Colletotrichum abscissum TaxID=1671311 RepID=A0A9P9X3P9_9PEZI|nr:uncharacterized protein CABS01_01370 [Colletotrichum abscissum]KAI3535075.1 hypothetical protein CABS02_13033 [Colletotrichum abscissum]KAK1495563.1 hypothetical protein CABS01_01370 [Colletotrichum abscissum]
MLGVRPVAFYGWKPKAQERFVKLGPKARYKQGWDRRSSSDNCSVHIRQHPTYHVLRGTCTPSIDPEPRPPAACRCFDCRQVSGSAFGVSVLVPAAAFACDKVTPTNYVSTLDSGNEVVNHFCGTCGVTLWADGTSSPFKFVKAGVLDDLAALDMSKSAAKIYTCRRAWWCSALKVAQQKEKM